jgi:hypothetical protein
MPKKAHPLRHGPIDFHFGIDRRIHPPQTPEASPDPNRIRHANQNPITERLAQRANFGGATVLKFEPAESIDRADPAFESHTPPPLALLRLRHHRATLSRLR